MATGASKSDKLSEGVGSSAEQQAQNNAPQKSGAIAGFSDKALGNQQAENSQQDTNNEAAERAAKQLQDINNRKRDEKKRAQEQQKKNITENKKFKQAVKRARKQYDNDIKDPGKRKHAQAAKFAFNKELNNYYDRLQQLYDVDKLNLDTGEISDPIQAGINPNTISLGQLEQEEKEEKEKKDNSIPFIKGSNVQQQSPIISENSTSIPKVKNNKNKNKNTKNKENAKDKEETEEESKFRKNITRPSLRRKDKIFFSPENQSEAIVENYTQIPDDLKDDKEIRKFLVGTYEHKFDYRTDMDIPSKSLDEFADEHENDDRSLLDDLLYEGTDEDIEIPHRFIDEDKIRKLDQRIYNNPFLIPIAGERIEIIEYKGNRYARIRYPETVETAINFIRLSINLNLSVRRCLQIVYLNGGFGVGKNIYGTIGKNNQKISDYEFPVDEFYELARNAGIAYKDHSTPFCLVQGIPNGRSRDESGLFVVLEGTKCFPSSVCPWDLALAIANGNEAEARAIQNNTKSVYNRITQPAIEKASEQYQRKNLETFNRSMANIDDQDYESLGIPKFDDLRLSELSLLDEFRDDPYIAEALEARKSYIDVCVANEQAKLKKKSKSTDSIGNVSSVADDTANDKASASAWFHLAAKMMQGMGAMRVETMTSGVVESASNLLGQKEVLFFLRKTMPKSVGDKYKLTSYLASAYSTEAAADAIAIASAVQEINGMEGLQAYAQEYKLTKEDFGKYVTKLKGEQPSGKFVEKLDYISDLLYSVMAGDALFKKKLAKCWIEMTLIEMAKIEAKGVKDSSYTKNDGTLQYYTTQQIEDSLNAGSIEDTTLSLMLTDAGYNSMLANSNMTFARKNPATHLVKKIVEFNGVTEFFVRKFFDKYPEYGMTKLQNMTPFSNTISYILSSAAYKIGENWSEDNSNNAFMRVKDYQLGGRSRSWGAGLRMNLLYDSVMLGNKTILGGVYYCVLQLLGGLYPPENEELIYNWEEWCIGAPASEGGVPIKWSWFMDDLSGIGLPLGSALSICFGWKKNSDKNNINNATNTFINSVTSFCQGAAPLDLIDMIVNADEQFKKLEQDLIDTRPGTPNSFAEYITAEAVVAAITTPGDFLPAGLETFNPLARDWILRGGDDRARSTSKLPDGKGYYDYSLKRIRDVTQNDTLTALVANTVSALSGNDANFFYEQMPVSTLGDQYMMTMNQPWAVKKEDLETLKGDPERKEKYLWGKASEAIKQMQICGLINKDGSIDEGAFDGDYLTETASIYKAISNGFFMDYETRNACINYCYWMIKYELPDKYNDYKNSAEYANGSSVDRSNHWTKYNDDKAHYEIILKEWLQNEDLPWSASPYEKLESDNSVYYRYEDGTPANAWAYYWQFLTGNKVEEVTYSYGNDTATILPFSSPRTGENIGFNFETIPIWYNDKLTDMDAVYERAKERKITSGVDEGKYLDETIMGGQGPHINIGENLQIDFKNGEAPTIDRRGYAYKEGYLPDELMNPSDETLAKLLGTDKYTKDKNDSNGTTNNSSQYGTKYGNGSGSSSYSPKIYSNPRSINSRSAQGMNTRSPYHRNSNYLRPNFETKGSREAYKRSDI